MKKLFVILSLIAGIYSCKKEQKQTNTLALLQGKWYLRQDTTLNYLDGKLVSTTYFEGPVDASQYIQFNSDGTGRLNPRTFTYNLSGQTVTLNVADYTYPGSGGALYSPPITYTGTIKTLTSQNMEVFYDMSFNPTGSVMRVATAAYYIKAN